MSTPVDVVLWVHGGSGLFDDAVIEGDRAGISYESINSAWNYGNDVDWDEKLMRSKERAVAKGEES